MAGLMCCGGAVALTSCNDFLTIYPTDRIVGTDFWKTKSDVDQMVDGAYKSMLDYSIQERAIMWGAYRSDELVRNKENDAYSMTTLDNISAVNLLPTMGYNSWAAFYKVINNCNIVLKHAPEVMVEDPEFTEDDYQVVKAQMLSLRSLCYFYLVRAFRDVPYITESVEDDSQITPIPQSSPATVLQGCLDDLIAARQYIMKSGAYGYGDWRNRGYMTRDAVDALIADIYLWRASMTHSKSDYQEVVNYTEQIINAKDAYYNEHHTSNVISTAVDRYHLEEGDFQYDVFVKGNSHESILEWQYNGTNNSNTALENYYYQAGDEKDHKSYGMLMASQIFTTVDIKANKADGLKAFASVNDYRFWNCTYGANSEEAPQLAVRKMIDKTGGTVATTSTTGPTKTTTRQFKNFDQNWIVYRLTDIMLMQAEAWVELAEDDADAAKLTAAFDLVNAVNKRSMAKLATDLLKSADYTTKSALEHLVMAERERELCFEGKRWFDLMRFCYRHMTGVDINQKMADMTGWPALHADMMKMIARKYGESGQGDAVAYKMKSEPYLYWPIQESETKVNNLLKQNPVFIQEKTTSKN